MASNKNRTFWWIVIFTFVIAIPSAFFFIRNYLETRKLQKAQSIRYTAFGIDMPTNYTIHGIDVSSYQDAIDWHSVKKMEINRIRIGFAFIKATEGLNDTDKYFKRNWSGARKDSITRGAYLFFLATKSGRKQAEKFIKEVQLIKGDLPPVVDVEELYNVKPDSMRSRLRECLKTLEEHYRVKPIIYSYANFYENNLGEDFNDYPLWIAHYFEKDKPRVSREWHFWQHSEQGKVNGIAGNVDFNVFRGDSSSFAHLLVK